MIVKTRKNKMIAVKPKKNNSVLAFFIEVAISQIFPLEISDANLQPIFQFPK